MNNTVAKTVYVLVDFDDDYPIGVYDTRELALSAAKKHFKFLQTEMDYYIKGLVNIQGLNFDGDDPFQEYYDNMLEIVEFQLVLAE